VLDSPIPAAVEDPDSEPAPPSATEPSGKSAETGDQVRPRIDAAQVSRLLEQSVAALGGQHRPGQEQMAHEVAEAFSTGRHLLVQAGTGTGKSLAYLIPAMLAAQQTKKPVIVATATLALQSQLVGRDLPVFTKALSKPLPRPPTFAIFKGRSNYACLARVRDGVPDEQGVLVEAAPSGPLGREVIALREWAEDQASAGDEGDRDHAPAHGDRAWAQVSIQARECPGATNCAFGVECFAERSRAVAAKADVVVTNHAMLAIDALEGIPLLPEYDIAVVDEGHELVARVTSAASMELAPSLVERAARRARPFATGDREAVDDLVDAGEALRDALEALEAGRLTSLSEALAQAVEGIRDSARAVMSAIPTESSGDASRDPGQRTARVMVDQVRLVAERIAEQSEHNVVWVHEAMANNGERTGGSTGRHNAGPDRYRRERGKDLRLAPLSVAGLLREKLFGTRTCVLTSATLKLGGDFESMARQVGLRMSDQAQHGTPVAVELPTDSSSGATGASAPHVRPQPWLGIDVGSPFDYARQAILYTASRLPTPGREGASEQSLAELTDLVRAAGGRTLGLFSSRRAAEAAAEYVRERLDTVVLCQGDAQLPELGKAFMADPSTSLFGTLSLWQGLDVPGPTCQLVVIDRIPFPRPDDPLLSARQRAVEEAGGNGFMSVAATHAALLLAQGTGRLIRRSSDRGVVACLDPRLVRARYGSFLRQSLPPMWPTTDREIALGALRRLDASAIAAEQNVAAEAT
jgi:ATP-dependent DNA helicase DinG